MRDVGRSRGSVRLGEAAILIGVACIAVGVPGCSQPPPPPRPVPAAVAAPPPPRPIRVLPIAEVVVKPASSGTATIEIDRAGRTGQVAVSFGAVPPGITVEAAPIAGDTTTGVIVVSATESLGVTELAAAIPVTATLGGITGQEILSIRVPAISLPSFEQSGSLALQPGTTGRTTLRIDRKDVAGRPLVLVGGDPVDGVTATVEPAGDDAEVVPVAVTVAAGVADGPRKLVLSGSVLGRPLAAEVAVQVLARPYRVETMRAVTLAPGESRTVECAVTRSAYDGPIDVAAEGLPEGVSIDAVTVAADADTATVTVRAAADAPPRVRSATIRTTGGDFAVAAPIVVRVRSGDDTSLPAAVTGSQDVMRLMRRGSIGGRLTSASKQALSDLYGGTPECEKAVLRGLAWLARNQAEDGSWTLRGSAAGDPGDEQPMDNPVAATAFGVLPFLGEGVTHKRAPSEPMELESYRTVVEKALVFLANKQVQTRGRNEGFFGAGYSGGMYAHSLATIAFCEAYGLSRDDRVKHNARLALKYLLAAQDDTGGGWRYSPGQPGDLSATGWVIIALRSGQLANLSVSTKQLRKAESFVDSCAAGPENALRSQYRYERGKPVTQTMTAAGLLSRLYLGWSKEEPDLHAGRKYLMERTPPESADSLGPMYFYYYATQVLHHLEGDDFDTWNHLMREHILRLQVTSGDQEGSWNPRGVDEGKRGGRMYATAMALLTLQVYYRHLPMYRDVKRYAPDSASASAETAEDADGKDAGAERR
jgi:hypothetical protein